MIKSYSLFIAVRPSVTMRLLGLCLEQDVLTCLEQPQDKSRHTASQDSSRRDGSMLLWCVAAYVYVAMLAAMNAISCAAY